MSALDAPDWTLAIDPKLPMATQAHAWIKRAILTLKFKPNEALSEKELSRMLGVSRTPVREALIKLADEGLVDIKPQSGTYVSPIRVAEVVEAQFIREVLETAVVGRAAASAEASLRKSLRVNLQAQQAAIADGDLAEFIKLDEAFHHSFSDSCNLPRAWRVIQNVKGQLDRVRYLSLPHPGHVGQLYAQHKAIAESVFAGQADVAMEHMRHHLREVFKSIDELMREQPSFF